MVDLKRPACTSARAAPVSQGSGSWLLRCGPLRRTRRQRVSIACDTPTELRASGADSGQSAPHASAAGNAPALQPQPRWRPHPRASSSHRRHGPPRGERAREAARRSGGAWHHAERRDDGTCATSRAGCRQPADLGWRTRPGGAAGATHRLAPNPGLQLQSPNTTKPHTPSHFGRCLGAGLRRTCWRRHYPAPAGRSPGTRRVFGVPG